MCLYKCSVMKYVFLLLVIGLLLASSPVSAVNATNSDVKAHCDDTMASFNIIGTEVSLPGFKNDIVDIYMDTDFYGQVVVEQGVVTEARCDSGHAPMSTVQFDNLSVVDLILDSENPAKAYIAAERANMVRVELDSWQAAQYRIAIFMAYWSDYLGFW